MSVLRQRVLTAVCIAAVFLVTLLWLPPVFLLLLAGLVLVIASWEWAGLSGLLSTGSRCVFSAMLVFAYLPVAVAFYSGSDLFGRVGMGVTIEHWLGITAAIWVFAFLAVLRFPQAPASWLNRPFIVLAGVFILLAAFLSLLFLRAQDFGIGWLLYSVAIVAAADSGAYFVGRRWGRHKLAVKVSPGKTWEGVLGGVLLAQIVALAFYWFWGDALFESGSAGKLPAFLMVAALQSMTSVLGDLFESLLKRRVSLKDSGSLLPGHGGVLDRIDGLLASLPVLVICYIQLGW